MNTENEQRLLDWKMELAVWPEMEMAKAPISKATAFHEVFHDKPRTVDTSKSAKGQRQQMIAIALSKAGLSKPGKKAKN